MVLRFLMLVLINFQGGVMFGQNDTLLDFQVYKQNGQVEPFSSVFKKNEIFVVLNGAFCLGCVEYCLKTTKSNKVLVILEDFSLTRIANFPKIEDAILLFVSEKSLNINSGSIALAREKDGELQLIYENKLIQLTENFTLKISRVKKVIKKYFDQVY